MGQAQGQNPEWGFTMLNQRRLEWDDHYGTTHCNLLRAHEHRGHRARESCWANGLSESVGAGSEIEIEQKCVMLISAVAGRLGDPGLAWHGKQLLGPPTFCWYSWF